MEELLSSDKTNTKFVEKLCMRADMLPKSAEFLLWNK